MDLGLKGQVALITGGTKGIGAGTARVLANEGCNLILNYRSDKEGSESFAKELAAEYNVDVMAYQADVRYEDQVNAMFDEALKHFGYIDILVNVAGGKVASKNFEEKMPDEWFDDIEACLTPVYLTCRRFVEEAKKIERTGQHIVNVSAKNAFRSSSKQRVSYGTAKGAIGIMSQRLANEVIDFGITVNAIVPGYVMSGVFTKPGFEEVVKAKEKEFRIGFATPEDMGNIIAFLCSNKSRQMIGVIVDASGGTMF